MRGGNRASSIIYNIKTESTDASDFPFHAHLTIAFDMDAFRIHYATYYNLLRITGLWPYDNTFLKKVQRVVLPTLLFICIAIQVSTLRLIEYSLSNLLQMLSFSFCFLLGILRYIGFIVNFPTIRFIFDNIDNDVVTMTDPVEAKIIMDQITDANRVILALLAVAYAGVVLTAGSILIPTILQSNLQIRYLNLFGFFFLERSLMSNVTACMGATVAAIAFIVMTCTESGMAVYTSYLCALLEIASHRMETAVNTMVNSENSKSLIDIRPVVELHQRTITDLSTMVEKMMISSLVAILAVIISFAINLYHLYLLLTDFEKLDNTILCIEIIMLHIMIMFINHYNGQKLMSTSIELFNRTYNTLWYRLPPKSQKMLFFTMMRSVKVLQYNLAGLFAPCYEGFSMMMSTSFSYFTMLLSVS